MTMKHSICSLKMVLPIGLTLFMGVAYAGGIDNGRQYVSGIILLGLSIVLATALLADGLCKAYKFPSVLGELFAGVILGNIGAYLGWELMILLREGSLVTDLMHGMLSGAVHDEEQGARAHLINLLSGHEGHSYAFAAQIIEAISFLGSIALLFVVGLENSPHEVMKNGKRSLMVAAAGVFIPLFSVWIISLLSVQVFNPSANSESDWRLHLFIGAVLSATSVGITAKIFKDAGKTNSQESRIILGAAVIDDILVISLLAIIIGILNGVENPLFGSMALMIKALLFIGSLCYFGPKLSNYGTAFFTKVTGSDGKEIYALSLCFLLAWFSEYIGLAAIVGAFLAGLILSDVKDDLSANEGHDHNYQSLLEPVQAFLTPVFFIIIGMQVKLDALFVDLNNVILAVIMAVVAWYGKRASGYFAGPGCRKDIVGIGMVPRGEVGLIFAALGKQMGIIDDTTLAMLVLVIIITTLLSPMILNRKLRDM